MMNYFSGCYLLLIIINTVHISHQACLRGWYGTLCNRVCRCYFGCKPNGDCTGYFCLFPYFGLHCQYVDILATDYTPDVPKYIRDSNYVTCNPNKNALSVNVSLTKPVYITFLWIWSNNLPLINNFTVTFDSGKICTEEKRVMVRHNIIEVMCIGTGFVTSVHIYGAVSRNICTLQISAGRVISYKQKTTQSSTLIEKNVAYVSSNAVDNDVNTCAATIGESKGSEWRISFSIDSRISVITVFTTRGNMYKLDRASMLMFDIHFQVVSTAVLTGDTNSNRVYPGTATPISYILIKQPPERASIPLAICDFVAVGDPVCPDQMYGFDCDLKCNCNPYQQCHYITGACSEVCPRGFYGHFCRLRCSAFCQLGACDYYTGECYPCLHGYFGATCKDECLPGTYGTELPCRNCSNGCIDTCDKANGTCACAKTFHGQRCEECSLGFHDDFCNKTCSEFCRDNMCDRHSGECISCKDNHTGIFCEECPRGRHGPFCDKTCSKFCRGNVCSMIYGECTLCIHNRIGLFCEDCAATFYGENCNLACPEHCLNGTCDQTYGTCNLCNEGYQGKMCSKAKTESTWLLLLLFLLACIPLIILFLAFKRSKQGSAVIQEEGIAPPPPPMRQQVVHHVTTLYNDIRRQSTTYV